MINEITLDEFSRVTIGEKYLARDRVATAMVSWKVLMIRQPMLFSARMW